ncbi:MAG: hypothetical protein M3O61_15575 [Gemmatimonadota bacterium]|nr:hypothetical protein [Gemmatimonadota bacterium]
MGVDVTWRNGELYLKKDGQAKRVFLSEVRPIAIDEKVGMFQCAATANQALSGETTW